MEIRLNDGKVALIDDEDFRLVSGYRWAARWYQKRGMWYVVHTGKPRICLHQLLIQVEPGQVIDHINGDTFDNRRSNLRAATSGQNCQNRHRQKNNTSGYRGVVYNKQSRKWQAGIRYNYRNVYLGLFKTAEEAARAYNAKAKELFGPLAWVNTLPNEGQN